jgi:hypothetical protein
MSATAEFRPEDRREAGLFIEALYRSAPCGSLVEVRFRTASGMGQRFHSVSRLDRLVESLLALSACTDVYVGVLPRRRRSGGRADVIERAGVAWADCDTGESVCALRAFRPLPGMVVASSDAKRHAYWFLRQPASVEVIEGLNRRIALALGADGICSDRARILRPAGSVNRKRAEPEAVRLLHLVAGECVSVADLDRVLPLEPAPVQRVTGRSRRPRTALGGRLETIPPPVYVEQLTGQRVRGGRPLCPGDDGAHPGRGHYPTGACRFAAASPCTPPHFPSTGISLNEASTKGSRIFARPVFPSLWPPGWNGPPLGSSLGFAPRRPRAGRRTPGQGQAIEHGPGTTRSASHQSISNPVVHS